jgi:predicted metal-dependent hydrolase
VQSFEPAAWRRSEDYLYGIDLYNFAYWWEAHEVLEELWHLAGHRSPQGRLLQGLIQLSAGLLHRFAGRDRPFRVLVAKGVERLSGLPDPFMGVGVTALAQAFRVLRDDPTSPYPLISLDR